MKSRSAKNKGKRLQNKVRDLLQEAYKGRLEPEIELKHMRLLT